MARVVSHHFLRRRARQKAQELNAASYWQPGRTGVPSFAVKRADRAPYRWLVVRL